jgi:hypothetical protein
MNPNDLRQHLPIPTNLFLASGDLVIGRSWHDAEQGIFDLRSFRFLEIERVDPSNRLLPEVPTLEAKLPLDVHVLDAAEVGDSSLAWLPVDTTTLDQHGAEQLRRRVVIVTLLPWSSLPPNEHCCSLRVVPTFLCP